jgi:UDP-galactopyranose mutase
MAKQVWLKKWDTHLLVLDNFMRGTRNTDRNTRKYITISENELWEYIDKIMELDEYKKSFNKVINKALMYGLPILYNSLFEMEEENKMSVQMIKKINGIDENYYSQITNLIKEVILNVTINKSILCSLYGIKEIETKGGKVDIKKIKKGAYRDTPDYLIDYEINGLNELRK